MQISLDGFVSTGPNDEQQWVTWAWQEIREEVLALADNSDTILIGKGLAVDYIPYWQSVAANPENAMYEVGVRIDKLDKVVFSKSVANAEGWRNTRIANGNLAQDIRGLKAAPGKDLVVYGGNSFVSSLIAEQLVDEFIFYVNPVALGKGEPIFNKLSSFQQLKLVRSRTFPSGIVLLHYKL